MRSFGRRAALGPLLAALAPTGGYAAEQPWPVSFGGPFALTDHTGKRVTDRNFRGSWLLVQFGYAGCPDLCPLSLDTLARALDLLGPAAARVRSVFITVDPARGTPEALAGFVPAFHPRLVGLTGSEAEIRAVAKAYRVHRQKVLTEPAHPDDYLIDHGSLTYLMGPDVGFVTLFPYGTPAERMAEVIVGHLRP